MAISVAFPLGKALAAAPMTTTILSVSADQTSARDAAGAALRSAGIGVRELDDWKEAAAAIRRGEASLVMCDRRALDAIADGGADREAGELPKDVARSLSHDLRTPLTAMAGWLHLMESGKLDEAGVKRAIERIRGNIDDQVRTIERYLGNSNQEGTRK
jgi:signal transduction histidine kinase